MGARRFGMRCDWSWRFDCYCSQLKQGALKHQREELQSEASCFWEVEMTEFKDFGKRLKRDPLPILGALLLGFILGGLVVLASH